MPKDNKKRGRREEKKRRLEAAEEKEQKIKRPKLDESYDGVLPVVQEPAANHPLSLATGPGELVFYGMLDQDEQDYFKRADEMLELNQFNNDEERTLFLSNIYREADGKELKLANSQSCSRLMERLVLLSTPKQLKTLFGKFSGHFMNLVQHRFASHCCEALFIHSAPIVTLELTAPLEQQTEEPNKDGMYASMENLFLYTLNELEGSIGFLMTDQFASHALRTLLLVLSGHAFPKSTVTTLLKSKRKENIGIAGVEENTASLGIEKRVVPESFHLALDKIISDIASGLDTTNIRVLATHPIGNPILQLLLELDLSRPSTPGFKGGSTILRTLIPDDPPLEGTESSLFINGLMYDAIGSRLLESMVKYAPGKTFKVIYRTQFKERMGSLVRNDIAGFVVARVLERLSKNDLEVAAALILPQVDSLVQRSRTTVIKTLINRCAIRALDTSSLAEALKAAYGTNAVDRIHHLLNLDSGQSDAITDSSRSEINSMEKRCSNLHGSLLAQSMLAVPGPLSGLIFESLLALSAPTLLQLAEDTPSCHVLQLSLTCPNSDKYFRRKVVQRFFGYIGRLAIDTCGSHLVDAFWPATKGLVFLRERIAEELLQNETSLRDTLVGRAVWRNWMMDLYKRRKVDWIIRAKAEENTETTIRKQPLKVSSTTTGKTAIELAREKYAASNTKNAKATGPKDISRHLP
ncbi:MAG: Nucleolar protein 9 [Candelina mexicana]|nr:MAG: Nucleolar protein 9 [Candelina mexicana]